MRRVLGSVAAVVALVLAGGWLLLGEQARALAGPLVDDAVGLEARRFELRAAGDEGSVFECVGPRADVSPDLSRTLPWLQPEVREVTEGTRAWSGLPLEQRALAEREFTWLAELLACGRRRLVAPVAGIGPFAAVSHGRRQTMPRTMDALASLGPLQMRASLERGDVEAALDVCASTLVLTTAWLRLEGLESMLATFAPTRGVLPACREALSAATPAQRAAFTRRLEDVRDLAPDYAELMRLERTQLALRLFGAWVPGELDGRLPEAAKDITRSRRAERWSRGVGATLALRLYWKRFDRELRAVEAAANLDPASRERDIVAAQDRLASTFLARFFSAPPVDLKYQLYAGYLDTLRAQLDGLTAAAR